MIFIQSFGRLSSIVLVAAIIIVLNMNAFWQSLYPVEFKEEVRTITSFVNVEQALIYAIITNESGFDPQVESKKGAVGLMQVMPATAEYIINQNKLSKTMLKDLNNPNVNIYLGSMYLLYLIKKYDENLVAAIAAYNAGPSNVNKWLESGAWDGQLITAKKIPFGETRHYVNRVFYYYKKYQKIYTNTNPL